MIASFTVLFLYSITVICKYSPSYNRQISTYSLMHNTLLYKILSLSPPLSSLSFSLSRTLSLSFPRMDTRTTHACIHARTHTHTNALTPPHKLHILVILLCGSGVGWAVVLSRLGCPIVQADH